MSAKKRSGNNKKGDEEGSKKRTREEELGFGTPAAKLGADICVTMGETLQAIHDTLEPCKTLAEFKKAREDVEKQMQVAQTKVVMLALAATK